LGPEMGRICEHAHCPLAPLVAASTSNCPLYASLLLVTGYSGYAWALSRDSSKDPGDASDALDVASRLGWRI
jgi:hypothetical protein